MANHEQTPRLGSLRAALAELVAGQWLRRSVGRRRHTDPRARDRADAREALTSMHFALHEPTPRTTPARPTPPTRRQRRAALRQARRAERQAYREARHV